MENNSEVARLRMQIEQEHEASVWALSGLAGGTARHDFIQRRLEHMGIAHTGLIKLLGEEQATAMVCEIFEKTPEKHQDMKEEQDPLARKDEPLALVKMIPSLTAIWVRLRPGQGEQLEYKLREICQQKKHCLPGTTARYIMQNQNNPEEIQIMLVWDNAMTPREQGKSLRRFFADLDDILDWQTASGRDYKVILTI